MAAEGRRAAGRSTRGLRGAGCSAKPEPMMQISESAEQLLRRAGEDEEFRRLLIDNPKSAIARELGIDVPEDVHITVLPETPNHAFVVLPSGPAHPQQQIVTGIERLAAGLNAGSAYGI